MDGLTGTPSQEFRTLLFSSQDVACLYWWMGQLLMVDLLRMLLFVLVIMVCNLWNLIFLGSQFFCVSNVFDKVCGFCGNSFLVWEFDLRDIQY